MEFLKSFFLMLSRFFGFDRDGSKGELRRIYSTISHIKPPYYKFNSNLIMPGLAQDVYLFVQALKPLMDLSDRTLSHPDVRVAQRFFDNLIDSKFPPEVLEKKASFLYDGMKSRVESAILGEEEEERIAYDFQKFLQNLDGLATTEFNYSLYEVERFIDICRHDWERFLGFFDPSISIDDPKYKPDFLSCVGDQIVPEIIDIYFLLEQFNFTKQLFDNVIITLKRYSPKSAEDQEQRINKLFVVLNKIKSLRLSDANILALIRLAKKEPFYSPNTAHEKHDYISEYRTRIVNNYERDRERLQRERHESAVTKDIKDLFDGVDIFHLECYNEENDAYLRRESPNGFTYVKAIAILKTFVLAIFEKQIKDVLKNILVEGYFDNKGFQNNLANVLYQCDKTVGRIEAFDEGLKGNGRVSIINVKRYVEEMRHGKDITSFLDKIVNEINFNAREICEDETGLFQILSDTLGDLLQDYRKSSPDLVNNIRGLGGMHNKEIMNLLAEGKVKTDTFISIMRNFTFIRQQKSLSSGVPAPVESDKTKTDFDITELEPL